MKTKNKTWDEDDWINHGEDQGIDDDHPFMITWTSDNQSGHFTATKTGLVNWFIECAMDPSVAESWIVLNKDLEEIEIEPKVSLKLTRS